MTELLPYLEGPLRLLGDTIGDVFPILVIIVGFQLFVLRRRIPNLKRVVLGFTCVILGMALFLEGLELALFPLGKEMARQLTDPAFLLEGASRVADTLSWTEYYWVYLFSAAIGFSTTIAEPSLIAVSMKARDVSGGAITVWGLRIAVAIGVAFGIMLGSFRIVTGTPLAYYIIAGYIIVIIQTAVAPKAIIPLAYDSGGVTTSTVTVPLVAALGLGLASTVPGRSAVLDGFGLIAFASVFPIMTVLGYAQISRWRERSRKDSE